jgi:hypothetical protein
MKTNMHLADRIIRILLAMTMVTLYFAGYLSGTLAIIALVVAIVFTITGFIGFCPLYALFRMTDKKQNE